MVPVRGGGGGVGGSVCPVLRGGPPGEKRARAAQPPCHKDMLPSGPRTGAAPACGMAGEDPHSLTALQHKVVLSDVAESNIPRARLTQQEGSQGVQSASLPWRPAWENSRVVAPWPH